DVRVEERRLLAPPLDLADRRAPRRGLGARPEAQARDREALLALEVLGAVDARVDFGHEDRREGRRIGGGGRSDEDRTERDEPVERRAHQSTGRIRKAFVTPSASSPSWSATNRRRWSAS